MTPATQASAAAEQPGDADDLGDIDADDAGKCGILADGPHRAADLRARQQQVHGKHQSRP